MAVESTTETFQRRRSWRDNNGWHHVRTFQVQCDDPHDGPAVAIKSVGLPEYGDEHPDDEDVRVISITCDPASQNDLVFDVVVEYGRPDASGGGGSGDPGDPEDPRHPWNQPAVVSTDIQAITEEFFEDKSIPPKSPVNTAGETFDTLPVRDGSVLQIVVQKNRSSRDIAADDELTNTINATTITIDGTTFPAGTLKMGPIRTEPVTEGDVSYFRYTYTLQARRSGWDLHLESRGYNQIGSDNKLAAIKVPDPDNPGETTPSVKPVPLDANGKALLEKGANGAAIVLKPYESKSWGITFS